MNYIHNIRIVSPSGVIEGQYIDGAAALLRSWGYEVSLGAHAYDKHGRFAGTDDARLADLVEALQDPAVDAILCARGGYGMQRIIDRVPPITKPIIGFSDITALHMAVYSQKSKKISTLHGIMCKHLCEVRRDDVRCTKGGEESVEWFRKALAGEPLDYRWCTHPLNRTGEAHGILVGGNLSVLYGLQGTPYGLDRFAQRKKTALLKVERPLLLIEDIGERHYHIDRMMRNLKMSGVLAQLSGLIVGQFTDCDDDPSMGCTVYETIKEAVAEYDYPVLFNAPVGHVEHNLPLWLNAPTHLCVTIEYASVHQPLRG